MHIEKLYGYLPGMDEALMARLFGRDLEEERAAAYPPFQMGQSHWRNEDVLATGDYVRDQPESVVDIQATFRTPADPELQGPDGVHPSLAARRP